MLGTGSLKAAVSLQEANASCHWGLEGRWETSIWYPGVHEFLVKIAEGLNYARRPGGLLVEYSYLIKQKTRL